MKKFFIGLGYVVAFILMLILAVGAVIAVGLYGGVQ